MARTAIPQTRKEATDGEHWRVQFGRKEGTKEESNKMPRWSREEQREREKTLGRNEKINCIKSQLITDPRLEWRALGNEVPGVANSEIFSVEPNVVGRRVLIWTLWEKVTFISSLVILLVFARKCFRLPTAYTTHAAFVLGKAPVSLGSEAGPRAENY